MCFSAEASFTAAGILTTIGILTLKEAKKPNKPAHVLYLAIIPLLFALQQVCEGIIWITMDPTSSYHWLNTTMTYSFLFFAGIFWPIWIPYALMRTEQNPKRQKIIQYNFYIGLLIGLLSAISIFYLGHTAQIIAHNIAYPLQSDQETSLSQLAGYIYPVILLAYLYITVGSSFLSTIPSIWIFGVLSLISFFISQILYAHAFGSTWCFFAAIISIVCYWCIRKSTSELNHHSKQT